MSLRQVVKAGSLAKEQAAKLLPELDARNRLALEVWRTLGGLDWVGLTMLLETEDIDDPGDLIERLVVIRNGIDDHDPH